MFLKWLCVWGDTCWTDGDGLGLGVWTDVGTCDEGGGFTAAAAAAADFGTSRAFCHTFWDDDNWCTRFATRLSISFVFCILW